MNKLLCYHTPSNPLSSCSFIFSVLAYFMHFSAPSFSLFPRTSFQMTLPHKASSFSPFYFNPHERSLLPLGKLRLPTFELLSDLLILGFCTPLFMPKQSIHGIATQFFCRVLNLDPGNVNNLF